MALRSAGCPARAGKDAGGPRFVDYLRLAEAVGPCFSFAGLLGGMGSCQPSLTPSVCAKCTEEHHRQKPAKLTPCPTQVSQTAFWDTKQALFHKNTRKVILILSYNAGVPLVGGLRSLCHAVSTGKGNGACIPIPVLLSPPAFWR